MANSALGRDCTRCLQTTGNAKTKKVLAYILRTFDEGMSVNTGASSRELLMPDAART